MEPRRDDAARSCREEGRQPHGRRSGSGDLGRTRDGRTLKRSEAHERMNPFSQESGGRRSGKTVGSVGNGEDDAGVENQTTPLAERIVKL
jgi:hypothetical protein